MFLSDVCLSVAYIGHNSRMERRRNIWEEEGLSCESLFCIVASRDV